MIGEEEMVEKRLEYLSLYCTDKTPSVLLSYCLELSLRVYPVTQDLFFYLKGLYTASSISVEMFGSTLIGFWY